MVYDRGCRGRPLLPGRLLGGLTLPGLTHSWIAGGALYKGLGRLDAYAPASSWAEAFAFLLAQPGPIREVQYWGHGKWGRAFIGRDVLDEDALQPGHPLHDPLARLRDRLVPAAAPSEAGDDDDRAPRLWFRTCETFGKPSGHSFARALARFLGARVAGHTYVIGPWQSGLHTLGPDDEPTWSETEGLPGGDEAATKALMSAPWAPHTITCLDGRVPAGF